MIIVAEMPPRSSRVVAALRDFGLRKAGTPLVMASTPVSAAQPDAKARSEQEGQRESPVSSSPCSGDEGRARRSRPAVSDPVKCG